jgi:ribosomal protein L16 Arg81 hydroxylase
LNTNIFDETFNKDFFLNNFGKKYLYKKDIIRNHSKIMSLDILNEILSIRTNWNNKNFIMMLDRKPINYSEYSSLFLETAGKFLRPDVDKVQNWISRGSSIVLNEIDSMNTGLMSVANELQNLTGGRCQGNLYFSMQSHQAFGPHCDEHDVFAIHFEGEKIWNIYENIELNPINHPNFKYSPEERIKKAGKLIDQVTLRPGDLLYLPRGQYHDALASKSGAIHVAFGLTYLKPIDIISVLWDKLINSDYMRQDIDKKSTKQDLKNHLKTIALELEKVICTDENTEIFFNNIEKWPYKFKDYSLNNIISEGRKYKVSKLVKIEKNGEQAFLTNGNNKVLIPKEYLEVTNFILKQDFVTDHLINSNFKHLSKTIIIDCLKKLNDMKVIS